MTTRHIYWISKHGSGGKIESWKSTGILEESIKNPHTSDSSFTPNVIVDYQFRKVVFKGICLK